MFTAEKEQVPDVFPFCGKRKIQTGAMPIKIIAGLSLLAVNSVSTFSKLIYVKKSFLNFLDLFPFCS